MKKILFVTACLLGYSAVCASGANLALNQPATASSIQDTGYNAANAVDGDTTTRWSSSFSDSNWIYVDLGSTYYVNTVTVHWENAYATEYKIQVSSDASNWTDAAHITNGSGGTPIIPIANMAARYVRMLGIHRSTQYGYSIWELQVYGTTNPPSQNFALGKTATASSIQCTGYEAANAVDGNLTTRWSSSFCDSQWICVNLGNAYYIDTVRIRWENACATQYNILVSMDSITWTNAASITDGVPEYRIIPLGHVIAKYVKMFGIHRYTPYGYSIYEFEVYGSLAPNTPTNIFSFQHKRDGKSAFRHSCGNTFHKRS